jgi:hypothetical protein
MSGSTSKPARVSVAASSARGWVVVLVIKQTGRPAARNEAIASIAPGIGSHEVTKTPSMSSRSPSTVGTVD